MALDLNSLQTAIKTAFKKAKDTPSPSDPSQAGQVQEQILIQLAADLASAMNAFVQSGDVGQITVKVNDNSNNPIGVGIQDHVGKIT